jgi:hypothetical protein
LEKLWLQTYIQHLALIHNVISIHPLNTQNKYVYLLIKQIIENSFLLIPRGDCPFVTKALHAQEMGAKMAIIMDN